MNPATTQSVPRAAYGLIMLAATLVAAAAAWLVMSRLGDSGVFTSPLLLALIVGSGATFLPVLMNIGKDHWGVAVLGAGMSRSLLVLALCYVLQPADISPRPLFMGALTGVLILLAVETAAAIAILSRLDRQRGPAPRPA